MLLQLAGFPLILIRPLPLIAPFVFYLHSNGKWTGK